MLYGSGSQTVGQATAGGPHKDIKINFVVVLKKKKKQFLANCLYVRNTSLSLVSCGASQDLPIFRGATTPLTLGMAALWKCFWRQMLN